MYCVLIFCLPVDKISKEAQKKEIRIQYINSIFKKKIEDEKKFSKFSKKNFFK